MSPLLPPIPIDVTLSFFAASLLLALAPGPDNIFVLTQSAVYGASAGIVTTLGLVSGLTVHTAAVALGVAAFFQNSPTAFTVLKIVGAAYLLYLAVVSFRTGAVTTHDTSGTQAAHFPGYGALYWRGVIMNVTNPKVSLFFLAFLPQFCDVSRGNAATQVVVLGILFGVAALLVFFVIAALGGRLALVFNSSPRGQVLTHRAAGLIFAGLAVALLFTAR